LWLGRQGRAPEARAPFHARTLPQTTNGSGPSATASSTSLAVEAKALADLKIEKAVVEGQRRTVEADLGPVRYLATLIGADNETVLSRRRR
jgi:hypothetical protein